MALPLAYNVRSLRVRWQANVLAMLGIGLVVSVFVTVMAMASGFRFALRKTGRADNAIVTEKGSQSELTSGIRVDDANQMAVDSRVARAPDGQPLASPEIVVVANLERRSDGEPTNVLFRGVTHRAFAVRGGIRIIQGRSFTPGLYEIIVGQRIQERMRGLDLGDKVKIQKRDWQVVGVFASEGSGFESEIWGDADVMAAAFGRAGWYQTVVLRLGDPAMLAGFTKELEHSPRMQVDMKQERQYYDEQAGTVVGLLSALAVFVSLIMGIGAVFGAMNTMYAIVAARTREIATLRALGFSRASILFSFAVESVVLALAGGALGCLLALPANGVTGATVSNFSELAFAFRVTLGALAAGMIFAGSMGLAGGLLPAVRAARLPITSALREA